MNARERAIFRQDLIEHGWSEADADELTAIEAELRIKRNEEQQ